MTSMDWKAIGNVNNGGEQTKLSVRFVIEVSELQEAFLSLKQY